MKNKRGLCALLVSFLVFAPACAGTVSDAVRRDREVAAQREIDARVREAREAGRREEELRTQLAASEARVDELTLSRAQLAAGMFPADEVRRLAAQASPPVAVVQPAQTTQAAPAAPAQQGEMATVAVNQRQLQAEPNPPPAPHRRAPAPGYGMFPAALQAAARSLMMFVDTPAPWDDGRHISSEFRVVILTHSNFRSGHAFAVRFGDGAVTAYTGVSWLPTSLPTALGGVPVIPPGEHRVEIMLTTQQVAAPETFRIEIWCAAYADGNAGVIVGNAPARVWARDLPGTQAINVGDDLCPH